MPSIFDGIRVADFTQGLAGALATMVLADNGAEVWKVEPPSGDPARALPAWRMWHRGKRSVEADLAQEDGRRLARRLAEAADVVVETWPPGPLERAGIPYEELARANPGLVWCTITALGTKGAYTDLPPDDGVFQAAIGGFVEVRDGWFKAEGATAPVYRARPQGSYGAANLAVQGIAAALRVRQKTGQGQRVETTLFQGFQCYDTSAGLRLQVTLGLARPDVPIGGASSIRGSISLPYLVTRCKDGQWIQLANNANRLFPNFMRVLGLAHLYQDPRFKGAPFSFQNEADVAALRAIVVEKMLEKSIDQWLDLFMKNDVAGDRFLTTQQCMDHPQMARIGGVVETKDPEVGKVRQIGPLVRFTATPARPVSPAPALGRHTAEACALAARPAPNGAASSASLPHALAGLLVLDFSSWLAGPVGPALIAELGARVIKVEPITGDEFRRSTRGMGRTFYGKENLAVDMKTAEGRAIVHKLLARTDGLVHNMRGGAPKRIGIDYESVRHIKPDMVYVYAGSYGSTGPGAGRAAFHPIAGAMTGGALWQIGRGNEPPPPDVPMTHQQVIEYGLAMLRANEGSPDVTSAIAVGTALAMGLYHRERTGQGQYVETTMLVANAYMASDDFIQYAGKPPRLEPDRSQRGLHALYRLYQAASGWVFLACRDQREWEAFCHATARADLLRDHRFAAAEARSRHDEALVAALGQLFLARPAAHWEALLRPKGVLCLHADRCSPAEFLLTDPTSKENGFAARVEHPVLGPMFRQGPPVRFSRTPGVAGPVHLLGEDTMAILQELGYSRDQAEDLKRRNIVTWPEPQKAAAGAR